MPGFIIQQRAPGALDDVSVGWERVATVEAATAPDAIRAYVAQQQWFIAQFDHHQVLIPIVGYFRAIASADAGLPFTIQRQELMGANDVATTWIDFGSIRASDATAAIKLFCEGQQWDSLAIDGMMFRPYGLGWFRVVPG